MAGSRDYSQDFDSLKDLTKPISFEVNPSVISVLVVDDEEVIRELVGERLKLEGYRVSEAKDGEEALGKISSSEYDLLLTDINMPVLNGLQLLRKIKESHDLPTVVMSGQGDLETAVHAMKLGASDYIFKPVNFRILLHTIESAIKKKMMQRALEDYRDNLEKKVHEQTLIISDFYLRSIHSLIKALEAKDSYTRGHSERVTFYSLEIAKEFREEVDLEKLRTAGMLHDLGKIGIPEPILNKPGRLTDEELTIVKEHPGVGVQILEPIESLKIVFPVIMHHHERFDGNGYPARLKGENIPIESRILAVADTFDAMTSTRAYRNALSAERAIDEITKCSGTQFDPDIARKFVTIHSKLTIPDHICLPEGIDESMSSRGD